MASRRPHHPLGLRLRTAVRRRHRLVAAALCAAALALAVLRLAPPGAQTVPVVTAARDVPVGHALTTDDLAVAEFPVALAPAGALASVTEAEGETSAAALTPGQPVTSSAVLGPGLLSGQSPETTAATVRVSDPAALRHVRPGDAVDVVHHAEDARSSPARTAARGVTVLWPGGPPSGQAGPMLSAAASDGDAGLVVLAAPRETAAELASLEGSGRISLVLVSR